jgi:hypothetical protein
MYRALPVQRIVDDLQAAEGLAYNTIFAKARTQNATPMNGDNPVYTWTPALSERLRGVRKVRRLWALVLRDLMVKGPDDIAEGILGGIYSNSNALGAWHSRGFA